MPPVEETWTYVPTARGFRVVSVRSLARFKGRVVRKIAGSDGPWVVTKVSFFHLPLHFTRILLTIPADNLTCAPDIFDIQFGDHILFVHSSVVLFAFILFFLSRFLILFSLSASYLPIGDAAPPRKFARGERCPVHFPQAPAGRVGVRRIAEVERAAARGGAIKGMFIFCTIVSLEYESS